MKIFLYFISTLVFYVFTSSASALSPMDYFNALVAGADDPGFRDGAFASARFNNPSGLAFNEAGNQLYVADCTNHRIRSIDLDRNNEVKTLAGTGLAGSIDGPFATATFHLPIKVTSLPGHRLAVFDAGSNSIRLIDIQKQTVSTLARGINIRDMVYRPKDENLYFSESDKVERINMKSLVISKLFSNNPQLPSPGALCIYHDNLCVADSLLPAIDEVKIDDHTSPEAVSFSSLGNAKDVLALSSSDGVLYAWQKGGLLAKVGLPDSTAISFPTPWGFLFKNQDHLGRIPLLYASSSVLAGFAASPREPRKFFVSTANSIASVKDYNFENRWAAMEDNAHKLSDFEYPAQKPAKVFRILVTGSSRNSTAVPIPTDPAAAINEDAAAGDYKVNLFSKQLEFLLNTEAALRGGDIHFEVLNLTRRGMSLGAYACPDIPDTVKTYDIDLVIGLVDHSGYVDYYLSPLTSEGVPARRFDVDHEYLKKPLSARAAASAASDLIKRCKELKIPISEKQDYPGDGLWNLFSTGDERLDRDLQDMAGRRLQLLHEKLNSMRTSAGIAPQLILFYTPGPFPSDCMESFWIKVCSRYQLQFLDLTESFNALKMSYYPTTVFHLTAYGNELIARLLEHYLIKGKLIPFKPEL